MNKKDVLHEFGFRINNGSVIGGNNWPIDRLNAMADEIIKLRTLLSLCSIECEDLHHNKADRHATFSEECPIVARINVALKRNI